MLQKALSVFHGTSTFLQNILKCINLNLFKLANILFRRLGDLDTSVLIMRMPQNIAKSWVVTSNLDQGRYKNFLKLKEKTAERIPAYGTIFHDIIKSIK